MRERPNILLLMTDQQRFDSLGCTGAGFAHTPNLDRLAREGMLFERCYVNNPICTPSRASMFTGKHVPGHGVHRLYDCLPEHEVLFTRRLQDTGYTTALFGKLHVSSRCYEERRRHPNDGFDVYEWCLEGGLSMDSPLQAYAQWLRKHRPGFFEHLRRDFRKVLHHPQDCHFTHWAAERTIDFIEQWDCSKPFLCMTSIFDPHNPYEDYPLRMSGLIDRQGIPDPVVVEGEFDGKPLDLLREHRSSYMGHFASYSADDLRRMRFGYHASIAFADEEFGRILKALERRGIAGNTLVIFTSDHGDMLGDHQLLVKGAFFYEANVRVPLIMRWPARIRCPGRASAVVQLHDLAATILAAAGVKADDVREWMPDAVNLLPVATGEEQQARDAAICCYRNSGLSGEPSRTPYFDPPISATMLCEDRYKLNLWHGLDCRVAANVPGELYDMVADPCETRNLWHDPGHASVREEMIKRLATWLVQNEHGTGSDVREELPGKMLSSVST